MSAEQLIALEAALAELSTLYQTGRSFAALQRRAEEELWPRLVELGARLRKLLRVAQLSADAVDRAAQEIASLRSAWQTALEELHASPVYQEALAAWAADRHADLARLIPRIFAGVRIVQPTPALFFPVSPSSGRRRPGSSPFLSASECARRIVHLLKTGIEADSSGSEWWERELAYMTCAEAPAALDTPLCLRLASADNQLPVFGAGDETTLRLFVRRLRAPMSVVLATEAADEWWQAYEESYESFRAALKDELVAQNVAIFE